MVKSGDNRTGEDNQSVEPPEQANEARISDLLDEIYDLEQFRREQLTLRKLSGFLKNSLTNQEALAAIECYGPQLWPGATGSIYLLKATGNNLERSATWGEELTNQSLEWQACWAMRNLQPHFVRDSSSEVLCQHVSPATLPSLCIPLVAQGQLRGLLHLQRIKDISETSRQKLSADLGLSLAVMVAEDLGLALANMSLRESLREQSIRDSLTGLFNRRFMDEYLVQEFARAERKSRNLSMIALDVDHFKHINDSFGHEAGDAVLKQISTILQAHVRDSDVAARIGGEEFLLLLAESSLLLATQRAESIRNAISDMSFIFDDRELGRITASFGAAAYPDHGRTPEALRRAVDKAMYEAKRNGRNQVVSAHMLN